MPRGNVENNQSETDEVTLARKNAMRHYLNNVATQTQKRVCLMLHTDGCTMAEAAAVLNISVEEAQQAYDTITARIRKDIG